MKRAAVLIALAVAACSGRSAPSETDIRNALAAANNRGAREAVKLACKQSPERPGFICDYRAPACNRYTGRCSGARAFTGRFLEAGGQWQLVEDLTPRAQPDPVTQPLPGVAMPAPTGEPVLPADPDAYPTAPPAAPSAVPTARPTRTQPLPAPTIAPPPPPGEEDDPRGEEPLRPGELRRISDWLSLDAQCRAGRRYDDEGWDACRERNRLARRLEREGLCHTGAGWQRC